MKERQLNIHRPQHYLQNPSGLYFFTARILDEQLVLDNDKKFIFLDVFFNLSHEYGFDPVSWVINDDHYHVIVNVESGDMIGKYIRRLNNVTSTLFNRCDSVSGRKVWYQYWDRYLRDDQDFWKHLNYCHFNPIKHKLVDGLTILSDYPFCSFMLWKQIFGQEAIETFFDSYPIKDFDPFNQ